jgi:hypothetical protein
MLTAAHGDHGVYKMCFKHDGHTEEKIRDEAAHGLPIYDRTCTEIFARRPWEIHIGPETGIIGIGGGSGPLENIASKANIEKFSCWQGLFGDQEAETPFEELAGFGTSPAAPLHQLDSGLQGAGRLCPERHVSAT